MTLLTFCGFVFDFSKLFECESVDFVDVSKRFSVVCDEFFDFAAVSLKATRRQNAALADGALSFVFVDPLCFVSFVKILI